MKTKILAIFLLICILIPCFAVFSSAEGDIYDNVDQNPFYNRTWKQASNGEYYNVNFDKYIDVEQYIKKAPDERRESFDIVGIEEYWGNGDDKCLVLYVYNPSNAQIPCNEPYVLSTAISGTVTFSFEYDEIAYVTPELHDDDKSARNMFVRFIVPLKTTMYDISKNVINENNVRTYNIKSFELGVIENYDNFDEPVYSQLVHKSLINKSFTFTGVSENKKQTSDGVVSLFDELSGILDTPSSALRETYVENKKGDPELVFMHERDAGTDEYALYVYVYNPQRITFNDGAIYFYLNGKYKSLVIKHVSSESTLSKFRVDNDLSEFGDKLSVREYFISKMLLSEFKLVNGRLQRVTTTVNTEARYVYSNIPTESFTPSSFVYDMTGYKISAPTFAGNGTGKFLKNEEYLVTFESKDIKKFEFSAAPGIFEITEKGDTWAQIKIITVSSNYITFDNFLFHATFPDIAYPDVSVSITRVIPDNLTEEEKASIVNGSTSIDVNVDFSPTRIDPVILTADGDTYVEPKALYLTAEVDGEIKIDGNYTYYRLDSSVNGNGYYQTLSTLYFSIPNKYLQSTALPLVDMYVKSLEIAYQSAMTNPILYENEYNEEFRKTLESIENHDSGSSATPFISSKTYDSHLMGHNTMHNHSEIMVGCYDYSIRVVPGVGEYHYISDKFFGHPDMVVFADDESADLSPMNEFLSTEEVKQIIINSNNAFSSDFEFKQFVLNFNDKQTLYSYKEMSFMDKVDEFGLWNALKLWLNGTTLDFSDSIYDISGIETLDPVEMVASLELSDQAFSNTYFVALSDVPSIKQKIEYALSNNESFVFARFDVFDYFVDYAEGLYIDKTLGVSYAEPTDFDDNVLLFQTKFYKDLDLIRLETSNVFTTNLYDVDMDEIDTPGGGATSPKPIIPDSFNNGISKKDSNLNNVLKIVAIVLVVALALVVIIYFWPFVKVLIVGLFKIIKAIFIGFRKLMKTIIKRN